MAGIIKRYVHNTFSSTYKATIGVDYALKIISCEGNKTIHLQLWDIAGQERFSNMTRVYYKNAVAAIIVYDVTRPHTLQAVKKWKQDIDSKVSFKGKPIPCFLFANKVDLKEENVENIDEFCRQNSFDAWFLTSAKTNLNIDAAMNMLVDKLMMKYLDIHSEEMEEEEEKKKNQIVKVIQEETTSKRKSKATCCAGKNIKDVNGVYLQ